MMKLVRRHSDVGGYLDYEKCNSDADGYSDATRII